VHTLRHSAASFLAAAGVPASDIAAQLGHANGGALALKVYVHPMAEGLPAPLAAPPGSTPWAGRSSGWVAPMTPPASRWTSAPASSRSRGVAGAGPGPPVGRATPRRLLLGTAWAASTVLTAYGGLLVTVGPWC
jgi:hypothetical protein